MTTTTLSENTKITVGLALTLLAVFGGNVVLMGRFQSDMEEKFPTKELFVEKFDNVVDTIERLEHSLDNGNGRLVSLENRVRELEILVEQLQREPPR